MAAAALLLAISSASAQQVFQTPEDAAVALANATLVKRMMWFDPDQTWKKVSAPSP
jgi:hypothetical protein